MAKLEVPPPLPIDWQMKDLSTAETHFGELDDGRLELRIKHDMIRGVTPKMLVWWFQNFHGTMSYKGQTIPMYRIWHPLDHIKVELLKPAPDGAPGGVGGALIEINERIIKPQRMVATVAQMDEHGINLIVRRGPLKFGDLKHTFTETPEGTLYQSRLLIGSTIPIIGPLLTSIGRSIFGRWWLRISSRSLTRGRH